MKVQEVLNSVNVDEFCALMDQQQSDVESIINSIPEDDMLHKETSLPNGQTSILGAALVNWPLKFLAAYRMQLFLYLKSGCGLSDLSTYNCWMGIDKPS